MIEELKKVAWISTGGLAIGIIVRHAHDALKGIPDVADSTLARYGFATLRGKFRCSLVVAVIDGIAIIQHRPFKEAKEHYEASAINGGWFSQLWFILIRALSTFSTTDRLLHGSVVCMPSIGRRSGLRPGAGGCS